MPDVVLSGVTLLQDESKKPANKAEVNSKIDFFIYGLRQTGIVIL